MTTAIIPARAVAHVFAPWTREQVKSLNDYQVAGYFHPFTCHCGDELIAHCDGWYCPSCPYRQSWAWRWMSDWTWEFQYCRLWGRPTVAAGGG